MGAPPANDGTLVQAQLVKLNRRPEQHVGTCQGDQPGAEGQGGVELGAGGGGGLQRWLGEMGQRRGEPEAVLMACHLVDGGACGQADQLS